MDVSLENDFLKISIRQKGAELATVLNKQTQLEYMWDANPTFWGKSSPVLFPIVGTLKDDVFRYKQKNYSLPRHGFARDLQFNIDHQQKESATFLLKSTKESWTKFPFDFELRLTYELVDDFMHLMYEVKNTGNDILYFSVGGHPAFKVPLTEDTRYEDYFLEFNKRETTGRWPLTAGLVNIEPVTLLDNSNILPLTRSLFKDDAVVLKDLKSTMVSLKSTLTSHGLDFYFEGFPFLGIWAAPNANFVCIEPWCGIADSVTHDQDFTTKEGIEKVAVNGSWSRTWKVKFY